MRWRRRRRAGPELLLVLLHLGEDRHERPHAARVADTHLVDEVARGHSAQRLGERPRRGTARAPDLDGVLQQIDHGRDDRAVLGDRALELELHGVVLGRRTAGGHDAARRGHCRRSRARRLLLGVVVPRRVARRLGRPARGRRAPGRRRRSSSGPPRRIIIIGWRVGAASARLRAVHRRRRRRLPPNNALAVGARRRGRAVRRRTRRRRGSPFGRALFERRLAKLVAPWWRRRRRSSRLAVCGAVVTQKKLGGSRRLAVSRSRHHHRVAAAAAAAAVGGGAAAAATVAAPSTTTAAESAAAAPSAAAAAKVGAPGKCCFSSNRCHFSSFSRSSSILRGPHGKASTRSPRA
mmetsp:Transcript_14942/g.59969  ORF Transcript_14942/g.59969 Transcript_14942/m.59969 type:complete len:350 (-) Transcript_14942:198-1247(-)